MFLVLIIFTLTVSFTFLFIHFFIPTFNFIDTSQVQTILKNRPPGVHRGSTGVPPGVHPGKGFCQNTPSDRPGEAFKASYRQFEKNCGIGKMNVSQGTKEKIRRLGFPPKRTCTYNYVTLE